jgi:hypothetical protein
MRRWWSVVLVGFLWTGLAQAQVVWVGAGAGATWEWQSPVNPDSKFTHHNGASPEIFVGFPIDSDTLFRVRVAELEHPCQYVNETLDGKILAYTVGVDYFVPGVFGKATFSAGLGAYDQKLDASGFEELEGTKFGYYFSVGEWFELTRRTRIAVEINYNRTDHINKPLLLTGTVSFVMSF